ncbi:MAG: hypothetical protein ACTHKP_13955 [Nitrososphaeraceae archaeon]
MKTNSSQRVALVALLIVSTFAVAGLTAVTLLSDSVVVAQDLGNDPIASCIKTVGETWVGKTVGDKQNWNETRQNFVSLLTTDNTIKLMNQNIAHNGYPEDPAKPITDTAGIWGLLNNGNMTQYDRFHLFLTRVILNMAAAKPGFTQIQQNFLGRCITESVNTLNPTPLY